MRTGAHDKRGASRRRSIVKVAVKLNLGGHARIQVQLRTGVCTTVKGSDQALPGADWSSMLEAKQHLKRAHDDPARFLPWLRGRNGSFAQMSDQAAATLFSLASVRDEMRASALTVQDEPARHLYIVISGKVLMRVQRNKLVRELAAYGPGEIAGLLSLVDQRPPPYELVTAGPAQLIAIDVMKLAQLRAAYHPDVTTLFQALTPILVQHLHDLDLRVEKLAQRLNASLSGSGETFRRDDR